MQKYVDVSLLLLYREMPIKINRKLTHLQQQMLVAFMYDIRQVYKL